MPRNISNNNDGTVLVFELARRNIYQNSIFGQPSMGFNAALAKYILKCAATIALKILGQEQASITTTARREAVEVDWQGFRVTLHNCCPKNTGKLVKVCYIQFDLGTGNIFVTQSYPEVCEHVSDTPNAQAHPTPRRSEAEAWGSGAAPC